MRRSLSRSVFSKRAIQSIKEGPTIRVASIKVSQPEILKSRNDLSMIMRALDGRRHAQSFCDYSVIDAFMHVVDRATKAASYNQ